jgi:hypothetical protein
MKEIKREPNLPAPTDCFGNEQPMATWYECPRCRQKSPLTQQWIGLDPEMMRNTSLEFNRGALWAERYLKEKNG